MRNKRRLLRVFVALVCLGAVMFVALVGAVCYCSGLERPVSPSDCIIVLGARVRPDGTLSDSLRYRSPKRRWRRGARGWPRRSSSAARRAGTSPMPEAVAMRGWLAAQGVAGSKHRVGRRLLQPRSRTSKTPKR